MCQFFPVGLIIVLALPSCVVSHHRSTVADEKLAYALSPQTAANIVDASIRAYVAPDYMTGKSADGLTQSGYYRMMIDTTNITASALPVAGRDAKGRITKGYGFSVTDIGTIIGLDMPGQIYEGMKIRAAGQGAVLKTD